MLKWPGPGACERSRPFHFRGCDLTGECLPATEDVRVRFPAAAPIYAQAARQHAAEFPKLSSLRAARRQPANFGVVADKQCTCPASKLMWERYPPTPPFHCGENEIQASLISFASVGATPTPATNFGK